MISAKTDRVRALIADDEPLLIEALRHELAAVWPDLVISAVAANGQQALKCLIDEPVDVAFLDIRMPGHTGLEVAQEIARDWPQRQGDAGVAPPLIVFVTAYGEFAIEAFESAAVDYLVKPVTRARLLACVQRLRGRLDERAAADPRAGLQALTALNESLRALAGSAVAPEYLKFIRAGVGDTVKMIPVTQVVLLEAADKYVLVHTASGQSLIRESLRELRERLDPDVFQQIHRSAIVNLNEVEYAARDENGKTVLGLRGLDMTPVVSRQFVHLFKAM